MPGSALCRKGSVAQSAIANSSQEVSQYKKSNSGLSVPLDSVSIHPKAARECTELNLGIEATSF